MLFGLNQFSKILKSEKQTCGQNSKGLQQTEDHIKIHQPNFGKKNYKATEII